jgi:hypothetical protein
MAYNWNKQVAKKQSRETLKCFMEFLVFEEKIWEVDMRNSHEEQANKIADKKEKFNPKKYAREDRYTGVTIGQSAIGDCSIHPGKGHPLEQCRTFLKNSVSERHKLARKNGLCFLCLTKGHMTKDCSSNIKCKYQNCDKPHHELLHASKPPLAREEGSIHQSSEGATEVKKVENASYSIQRYQRALLGVIPVTILGPLGSITLNAFLDYGSNTTLINLAVAQEIGIVSSDAKTQSVEIMGIHGAGTRKATSIKKLHMQAAGNKESKIYEAKSILAVEDLEGPSQEIQWETMKSHFPLLDKYDLINVSAKRAEMIIGTDNFHLLVYDRYITSVREKGLVLVHTALGYALFGKLPGGGHAASVYRSETKIDPALTQQLEEYFMTENLGIESKRETLLSAEDQLAMKVIAQGTIKTEQKTFISRMPWKSATPHLPNNREMALRRLHLLEKRLLRAPELYAKYRSAIEEDIRKGYIRELSAEEDEEFSAVKWYLPHWNVIHKKKPDKFRRVYDCSATYDGESLNKQLHKGPNLLTDLLDIMLRFREYPIALAADINEMYNQIRIPEDDQACLQFLWRNDTASPVKTYRFCRMLFGDVSAPCRAVYVLKCIAQDGRDRYPNGAKAIKENMYLDDLMASCQSVDSAVTVQKEAICLMEESGFHFKKWASNAPAILQAVPEDDRAVDFATAPKGGTVSNPVLGVVWEVDKDCFGFGRLELGAVTTKRQILSQVTSLWDPMGFLAPYVLRAKIMIQDLWSLNVDWDTRVPEDILQKWRQWTQELQSLHEVKVVRSLTPLRLEEPSEFSLQVFCDASQKAYATVVYARSAYENGEIYCRFVIAKVKVAPKKPPITIPRLELNAAVLAARIAVKVCSALTRLIHSVDLWSDSMIVLNWLNRKTINETAYVINRISAIEESLQLLRNTRNDIKVQWRHLSSENNVSDDSTRGLHLFEMVDEKKCRFHNGPDFVKQPREDWPTPLLVVTPCQGKLETWTTAVQNSEKPFDLERYSSFLKAQRVAAFVLRFLHNCKTKNNKRRGSLQVTEYALAESALLRQDQQHRIIVSFSEMQKGGAHKQQWLLRLNPMIVDGLIRVGGRLGKATLMEYSRKHPVILDGTGRLAFLIVRDFHQRYGHAGQQFIMNAVREEYWILKLSWLVKKVKSRCVVCRKREARVEHPQMAELPQSRVEPTLPFVKCGVDYFGPFLVKRGRSTEKAWGVIFTCFSTRAVHLELAESLATEAFINAFRRFTCRRGEVMDVWSDNGTNFVGAERELKTEIAKLKSSGVAEVLATRSVNWHFNPPAASHFGGAWERLIRSIRKALHAVMKGREMKYAVLETALIEVEALLNSRPISKVSMDAADMSALTPGHFLILRPYVARPFAVTQDREVSSRNAWKCAQALVNMFWKRWLREYVPNLRELPKWRDVRNNIKQGDVVLLIDSSTQRGKWPLGIIDKVFPGTDGIVRVVDVMVNGTVLRRPVAKLSYVFGANENMCFL